MPEHLTGRVRDVRFGKRGEQFHRQSCRHRRIGCGIKQNALDGAAVRLTQPAGRAHLVDPRKPLLLSPNGLDQFVELFVRSGRKPRVGLVSSCLG